MIIFSRLAIFAGCCIVAGCSSPSSVFDANLKERLSSASRAELVFTWVDSEVDSYVISLDADEDVKRCVRELTTDRKWVRRDGEPAGSRCVMLRFEDSYGRELWRCKLASMTLISRGT